MTTSKKSPKIKKKYDSVLIGVNFTGLLTLALMASHGAVTLALEKNKFLGGRASSFKEKTKDGKEIYFERDFIGLYYSDHGPGYKLLEDIKAFSKNEFINPKIKYELINGKRKIIIYNDLKKTLNEWKHKFPLVSGQLKKFISDLKKASVDNIFLNQMILEYKSVSELLSKCFNNSKEIANIFELISFNNCLPISKIDPGYFINSLINVLVNTLIYPKKGTEDFILFLAKIIYNAKGDLYADCTAKKIIKTKNELTSINFKIKDKSQNLSFKKYLIGLPLPHLTNDLVFDKTNLFKEYRDLTNQKEKYVKIKVHFSFNKNYRLSSESLNILINEHNNSNKSVYENINKGNGVNDSYLNITNYTSLQTTSNTKNTVNIEFIDLSSRWENIKYKSDQYNKICEKIIKNITKRMENIYKSFTENIIYSTITTPLHYKSYFYNITHSYTGFSQDQTNPFLKKTSLTPWHNTTLVNKFGSPGGCIKNALKTAYYSYHLFDFKYKSQDSSLIDTFNAHELLQVLRTKYMPHKKANNNTVGFHFDHENSIIIRFTPTSLIVKRSTFDEAFNCKYFVLSNLSVYKNILQRRKKMTKEVIMNTFRVKGGVWAFQKLMKRTNLYYLTEEEALASTKSELKNEKITMTKNLIKRGTERAQLDQNFKIK